MNLQQYGIQSELPDFPLYHYTSTSGLLGMIQSKSIWMSNIRYQNDIEEYKYIFRLTNTVLKEEYKYPEDQLFNLETLDYNIPPLFTFSLSAEKDLLSQWRGYCPNGGYSFSFNKNQLSETIKKHGLEIHNCVYDIELQKEIIRKEVIRFSPEEWHKSQEHPGNMTSQIIYSQKYLWTRASRLAPLLKSYEFREEAEWRMIKDFNDDSPNTVSLDQHPAFIMYNIRGNEEHYPTGNPKNSHDTSRYIEYREGQGTIIPYLAIPIAEAEKVPGQHIEFSDMIVSPGSQQELATIACKTLLYSKTGIDVEVHYSKIPYRK